MKFSTQFADYRKITLFDKSKGGNGSLKIHVQSEDGNGYLSNSKKGKKLSIKGFSAKSKKNFSDDVQTMKRIKEQSQGKEVVKGQAGIFITLTYGQKFPTMQESKINIKRFIARIKRKCPSLHGWWRLEPQGNRCAPHFHIVLFDVFFIKKEDIAEMWSKSISIDHWDYSKGEVREPFTRVEKIKSRNGVACYVGKYVSKAIETKTGSKNMAGHVGFNCLPYWNRKNFLNSKELVFKILMRHYYDVTKEEELKKYILFDMFKEFEEAGYYLTHEKFQRVGELLKFYIKPHELEILSPTTGRLWGKINRKAFEYYETSIRYFQYNEDLLLYLKRFSSLLRDKAKFNLNNNDGGFTLYLNNETERKSFLNILENYGNEVFECPVVRAIKSHQQRKEINNAV